MCSSDSFLHAFVSVPFSSIKIIPMTCSLSKCYKVKNISIILNNNAKCAFCQENHMYVTGSLSNPFLQDPSITCILILVTEYTQSRMRFSMIYDSSSLIILFFNDSLKTNGKCRSRSTLIDFTVGIKLNRKCKKGRLLSSIGLTYLPPYTNFTGSKHFQI